MEIIIAIAVVVIVGGYFIYKRADKNGDGRVDAVEAKAAVEEVKVVVQEAKTQVKKAAVTAKANMGAKTRAAVNKATTKKPAAKKPAAKK